jgi:hypothetical protein
MDALFVEFLFIGLGLGLGFYRHPLAKLATFIGFCIPLIPVMLVLSTITRRDAQIG